MHVIDSLAPGGAERVAMNLANLMPRDRYRLWLCTTRHDGPLAELLAPDVERLSLARTRTLDCGAIRRLAACIRQERIQVVHAHQTALFITAAAVRLARATAVVWHDHFGRYPPEERHAWLYRLATRRIGGVMVVNRPLVEWAQRRLHIPADRVWYVRNFVCEAKANRLSGEIPGTPGRRIVCVANLRPEKDHATLVLAMARVARQVPEAHLLLVGGRGHPCDCRESIEREIHQHGLGQNVSLLGHRDDVAALLRHCDIGVICSTAEGMPLSLLEYGMAGLACVATNVGQCPEVLDDGVAGLLVAPGQVEPLAESLLALLTHPERRAALGRCLEERVRAHYSPDAVVTQVESVYDTILAAAQGRKVAKRAAW
jgi:glycosyltransferase involved in cell wall biosynthesis